MNKRLAYVPLNEEQKEQIMRLRGNFEIAFNGIDEKCLDGRGKALALTKLEESLFWANKAICGNDK